MADVVDNEADEPTKEKLRRGEETINAACGFVKN